MGQMTAAKWHAKTTEDVEEFIQALNAADCVELTPSCKFDDWCIAIHDTDQKGSLVFYDKKHNCEHLAHKATYQIAIALSPLDFYFIDNNYPEVIYYGSWDDFHRCMDEGGAPERWHGPVAPVGKVLHLENGMELEVVRMGGG